MARFVFPASEERDKSLSNLFSPEKTIAALFISTSSEGSKRNRFQKMFRSNFSKSTGVKKVLI